MSGHSKWSTIKRQKEVTDKKRGQVFSKMGKVIAVAARDGADPESNFKLRLSVEKAKQMNMPRQNIERAIKKGSGQEKGAGQLVEVTYEAYGPLGIALMIEAVTDNRNRASSEIKNILERGGGSLASPGAVAFQFKKVGLITLKKENNIDNQLLALIDLGVDDVEEARDVIEVYTQPSKLSQIKEKIDQANFEVTGVELIMEPISQVKIEELVKAKKVLKFIEALESHDDVQKIYANFDIPEKILKESNV